MNMNSELGTLNVLNVTEGDVKLTFDSTKPEEVEKAKATVMDMLRRGYCVLVEIGQDEHGPVYRRVQEFDASTTEYIVAGVSEEQIGKMTSSNVTAIDKKKRGRVPAGRTKATAVAPVAGG